MCSSGGINNQPSSDQNTDQQHLQPAPYETTITVRNLKSEYRHGLVRLLVSGQGKDQKGSKMDQWYYY